MSHLPDPDKYRKPDYPVEPIIYRRWSPRAMSGEPISEEELLSVFEAARWAPSTYNEQEWRFLYARRETPEWQKFFDLLTEGNRSWCRNAAVLVVVLSRKTFTRNGKPNVVHLYDAGAAWENAALQASAMGLVAHGMAGFDYAAARLTLHVPDHFDVAAMFALGHPGDPDSLPADYRKLEAPSPRRPARASICEGIFNFPDEKPGKPFQEGPWNPE